MFSGLIDVFFPFPPPREFHDPELRVFLFPVSFCFARRVFFLKCSREAGKIKQFEMEWFGSGASSEHPSIRKRSAPTLPPRLPRRKRENKQTTTRSVFVTRRARAYRGASTPCAKEKRKKPLAIGHDGWRERRLLAKCL